MKIAELGTLALDLILAAQQRMLYAVLRKCQIVILDMPILDTRASVNGVLGMLITDIAAF